MFVNLYGGLLVQTAQAPGVFGVTGQLHFYLAQSFGIQRNDVARLQVQQIASRNTQVGPLRAHRHLHVIVSWIPVHVLGPMLFYILIRFSMSSGLLGQLLGAGPARTGNSI